MNRKKKIYIVSSLEPNGATWLINCFLELGIKTYRRDDPNWMWHLQNDNTYKLNPEENILKKWLPILSSKESFNFRDNIEVEWTHDWPRSRFVDGKIIYFIRDPRDSIYSRYKRSNSPLSFTEYVKFPDIQTLLNKITNWNLFNKVWINFPGFYFFRFEDYKTDSLSLLKNILAYLDLSYDEPIIDSANNQSTSKQAELAEVKYRKENNEDKIIINRGGIVGNWKNLSGPDLGVIKSIEYECKELLLFFGYSLHFNEIEKTDIPVNNAEEIINVNFFRDLHVSSLPITNQIIGKFTKHRTTPGADIIFNAGLDDSEILLLHTSITEYFNTLYFENDKQFAQILNTSKSINYTYKLTNLKLYPLFKYEYNKTDYDLMLFKQLFKRTIKLFFQIPLKVLLNDIYIKLK